MHVSGDWQPAHHVAQPFSLEASTKNFSLYWVQTYSSRFLPVALFSSLDQVKFLFPQQLHVKAPGCPPLHSFHTRGLMAAAAPDQLREPVSFRKFTGSLRLQSEQAQSTQWKHHIGKHKICTTLGRCSWEGSIWVSTFFLSTAFIYLIRIKRKHDELWRVVQDTK